MVSVAIMSVWKNETGKASLKEVALKERGGSKPEE